MFLHGWGGDFNNFAGSILAMEKSFLCVNMSFFDVEERLPLRLTDYVEFVQNIISELRCNCDVTSVMVVGHSFGGRVAIRLAAAQVVDKIILVDSAGLKPRRGLKYFYRRFKSKFAKFFNLKIKRGSKDYQQLSPMRKLTFSNIVTTFQDKELCKITIPTLIIWGEKDRETPLYMAKKLNREIKDSGLVVFKNAGHYSYLDKFNKFIAIVNNFARSESKVELKTE